MGIVNAAENGGFVPINVMFKNTSNGEVLGGSQGFIKRPPDVSRGENVTSMEWMFELERYDIIQPLIAA